MSRLNIMQDVPAHICWEYLNGSMSKADKEEIDTIVRIAVSLETQANAMIREIAYRIGFFKSVFADYMSEVTYKKKKQWIRNTIKKIAERRENERT